jgi:hypothetical protein
MYERTRAMQHLLAAPARLGPLVALAPLAALAALPACKTVYAPNIASTPLLRERGELRATVDRRNLQLAYAVADHLGLLANGYHRKEDETTDDGEHRRGRGDFVELGAGYFTPLPRVHEWLQLEVYGGLGAGTVSHDITPAGGTKRHFETTVSRAFLMPTVGVTRKWFDVALSVRVAGAWYTDPVSEDYGPGELEGDGFADLGGRVWWFLEPALTVRAGYKWVKLELQVGRSIKLNTTDLQNDPGMVTLGLNVDLFRAFE